MPDDDVFRWIDWAVDNGLSPVRFTGGEPTLHPRLKVYCGYARLRQRFVIAQEFVVEMAGLMERYPEQVKGIFLAVPFCAVSPVELGARVFHGRVPDCGPYGSLTVNARGRLQACCCVREELTGGTLAELKTRPDFQAVCSRAVLPEECQRCAHVSRCGGGCRKPEGMVLHRGRYIDYLAQFVKE